MIPPKARTTLEYVMRHGQAPEGVRGGRRFANREGNLPESNHYREYDVDVSAGGLGERSRERIVVDMRTHRAWYTADHYASFTEIA